MDFIPLGAVFGFVCADVITGLTSAIYKKTFKSRIMRQGIFHKLGEIFSLILVYGCQYLLPMIGIVIDIPLVQTLTVYLVVMEIGSIIENLCILNPQLKETLTNLFSFLKGGKND